MAKHIENIVIGKPIVEEWMIFGLDKEDWETVEKDKTMWTEERNLAAIMRDLGIVKSVSEVRRNKPELAKPLTELAYNEVKWGKHKLFVLVGE